MSLRCINTLYNIVLSKMFCISLIQFIIMFAIFCFLLLFPIFGFIVLYVYLSCFYCIFLYHDDNILLRHFFVVIVLFCFFLLSTFLAISMFIQVDNNTLFVHFTKIFNRTFFTTMKSLLMQLFSTLRPIFFSPSISVSMI